MSPPTIQRSALSIPQNRQRKEFDPEKISDLSTSIGRIGLINLPVLKHGSVLVAGERRIKAIEELWITGGTLRYQGQVIPEGFIPFSNFEQLDPVDAYEIELEENIRRTDLTWQEQAEATSRLMELRRLQAEKAGRPAPTVTDIAKEIRGEGGAAFEQTRAEVLVAKHLSNPEVAKSRTAKDALKVIKRQEELQRSAELGRIVGATFGRDSHSLVKGDALAWLESCGPESFDCILTDPIYGINAQDFNDSDGKAAGGHFYDDSYDRWLEHMWALARFGYHITKPQAHLYAFCDIDNFSMMKSIFTDNNWKVFRTPFIWVNPKGQRAPWPQQGPHRKYQCILYAVKGDRHVLKLAPDVMVYPSDDNLNHNAQKPVALFQDLLSRTCNPGDTVLDCFCGSGPIFPAAHELKVKATGIELDDSAYSIRLLFG